MDHEICLEFEDQIRSPQKMIFIKSGDHPSRTLEEGRYNVNDRMRERMNKSQIVRLLSLEE
jgi:hypothetical protein